MPREVLRELAALVRHAESDGESIGCFVADNAGELAPLLGSQDSELVGMAHETDGALVDRLRIRLELAFERERQRAYELDVERAHHAARELGRTARWFELGVVLDIDVVLRDLVADRRCKFIAFKLPGTVVRVPTSLLRRARFLRRTYIDAAVFVDDTGICFKWNGGRGALRLRTHGADAYVNHDLVVELPAPRSREPTLIGDVLIEIGFAATSA